MIYLDNAATSFPKPAVVYDEVMNCMKNYCANPGRSAYDMAIMAASKIMEARQEISFLFNIPNPFNIIFTSNATESLNIGIKGALNSGDHVISTMIEHNSVLRPLYSLEKMGIEVTLVSVDKRGYIDINEIEKNIKTNTKMIIVNHSSNVLGTIQNIKQIGMLAKSKEILFMADCSQSAGVIPIDVKNDNIDLLAVSGHKGLMGPQGTGCLYIKEGLKMNNFKEGGTGSRSHFMIQPDFMPDKFESGTLNTPGIAGLCEGIKFIKNVGINIIKKHEEELMAYMIEEFKRLPYIKIYGCDSAEERNGVISFNIDGFDSSIVGEKLNEKGIAVRTGYHCAPLIHEIINTEYCGTVRVSLGYFNTFKDIESLIDAVISIYN